MLNSFKVFSIKKPFQLGQIKKIVRTFTLNLFVIFVKILKLGSNPVKTSLMPKFKRKKKFKLVFNLLHTNKPHLNLLNVLI